MLRYLKQYIVCQSKRILRLPNEMCYIWGSGLLRIGLPILLAGTCYVA